MSPAGEGRGVSIPALAMRKYLSRILAIKGSFFTFFEELKNIENRVAWFLAELCKAKKKCAKRQGKPAPNRAHYGVFSASPGTWDRSS
jgi:hypothetical protein